MIPSPTLSFMQLAYFRVTAALCKTQLSLIKIDEMKGLALALVLIVTYL